MPRLVLALLLAGLVSIQAQEPKASPPKKETKDSKAKSEEKKESSATDPLAMAIPAGMPMKGIRVPYMGPDGKTLQMVFDAGVATKVDAKSINMDNLKIEVYGDDGKKFNIDLPHAVFNLENRILTGRDGILITREDFRITGDTLEFQTKTRFGKIIGNVKMTILSTENFE